MDEAFLPLNEILNKMLAFGGEIVDEANGMRFYVEGIEIETPFELNVFSDEQGHLRIGTAPPLYHLETSSMPSFHQLRFTARLAGEEVPDGE